MLEDSDQIDIIRADSNGTPFLFITDSGATTEPSERLELYKSKAIGYRAYMCAPEFQEKFPNWPNGKVIMQSPLEPSAEMKELNGMKVVDAKSGETHLIEIQFDHLPVLF